MSQTMLWINDRLLHEHTVLCTRKSSRKEITSVSNPGKKKIQRQRSRHGLGATARLVSVLVYLPASSVDLLRVFSKN